MLVCDKFKNGGDSGAGLQREYEKVDDLNHLVRMVAALPFSPPDKLEEVFHLLTKKASEVVDKKLREFAISLVKYAEDQWRNGDFSKQDWNLFDINVLMVPATNNGNEGTNRKNVKTLAKLGKANIQLLFLACVWQLAA